MRTLRIGFAISLFAAVVVGVAALTLAPVSANPTGFCPQPPGPPGIDCRGCPTYEDPVVCTVVCQGGPQQKSFSNRCFASCSGYIFLGDCVRTGG